MKDHAHYALVQDYTIKFHEPEYEHDKRLFHVILAHEDLLDAVCELQVLQAEAAEGQDYVAGYYGDMNFGLGNLLARFLHYFSKEDQAFILAEQNSYEAFMLLGESFKDEPGGFDIVEYDSVVEVENVPP